MMIFRGCFIVIFCVLLWPSFVWGGAFHLTPSGSLKEEYNDNILLDEDDVKSDYITTFSGGIAMAHRTDRLDTDFFVRLDWLEYARNDEYSGLNQNYTGKIRFLATPLLTLSADAGYSRNTNPTLDVETTGEVLRAETQDQITSAVSAKYQFIESTSGSLSYGYAESSFDDEDSSDFDNRGSSETRSHDANAGLTHDLSKYFAGGEGRLNIGYRKYDSSDAEDDIITGSVGFSSNLTEIWKISLDTGVHYSQSDITTQKSQRNNTDWGWLANASIHYQGERSSGALSYVKDISPAYDYAGAAESDALRLSYQYNITYDLEFLFTTAYSKFESDPSTFSAEVIDEKTFTISPSVRYRFSKDVFGDALYSYVNVDDSEADSNAERHRCYVSLSFQHTFFE